MGLLDKAKEKKQDEGPTPEPEVTEDTAPIDAEKTDAPQKKKKVKKSGKSSDSKKSGKKSAGKKKSGMKSPMKKKMSSPMKRPSRPKKEKVVKEPEIEGLPENLEFATWPKRAGAQVLDGLILGFILFITLIILVITIEDVGLYIWLVLYFIIPPAYYITMEGNSGQTIGKGMAHVKVLSLDGRKLTPTRVLKSSGVKGLLFPIFNIIDAILGVFVLHADSRQRYTQYEDDLIVIAVEKKKLTYGSGEPSADDEDSEGEGGSEDGEEAPVEEEFTL